MKLYSILAVSLLTMMMTTLSLKICDRKACEKYKDIAVIYDTVFLNICKNH